MTRVALETGIFGDDLKRLKVHAGRPGDLQSLSEEMKMGRTKVVPVGVERSDCTQDHYLRLERGGCHF